MFTPKARQGLLINGGLFVLLVLAIITVTSIYVSSEHTFYWWDYNLYQDLTKTKAIDFRESPIKALYYTWRSTGADYSEIPTLLLVPFIFIFGDSRLVYILSIALVYLLPFTLVVGMITTRLIPFRPSTVFWSTVLLTLLTPVTWVPTLRGYVDAGAALLIALAILVYLQDPKLKNRWQIVLIGFFIAVAMLFRRHFVYDGIAFFGAMVLQTLITYITQVRQRSRETWRNLFNSSVRIGCTIAVSLITLVVLGLPFIKRVLTTNFSQLYASFEVSPGEGLRYYGTSYGWIACIVAGLGFAGGIQNRVLVRPVAVFIILFGSFSLMQWVFKVKQLAVHYTLHFTPFVVLGLVAFGWTAWLTLKPRTRRLVLSASGIYLILNAVMGLAFVDVLNNTPLRPTRFGITQAPDITGTKLSEIFSANYPPLKHADYSEVARLVSYLRSMTSGKEPIYTVAASSVLNYSLLRNAELTLHPNSKERLQILGVPDIDTRDKYPLEGLLQAQYVLVANPFQYNVRPDQQKVVKVVVDAFNQNWEIAHDFVRLPEQFTLSKGTVVDIYKRSRSTSLATTLHTLKEMRTYLDLRPGGQLDWLNISEVPGHEIWKFPKQLRDLYSLVKETSNQEIWQLPKQLRDFYHLSTQDDGVSTTSFLYLEALPDEVKINGNLKFINKKCNSTLLRFDAINSEGEIINTVKLTHQTTDSPQFRLPLKTHDAAYLLFNISINDGKNDSINHCLVRIDPLFVER